MGHPIVEDVQWMALAKCKGRTALFFAPNGEGPIARAIREAAAQALCRGCTVQDPCRAHGRDHREYGIWGGETEAQRVEAGVPLVSAVGLPRTPAGGRIGLVTVRRERAAG